ncbi:cytochrome P450 [Streptomyces sp. NPDC001941]|uniref:cytochrome P450 n=1 Tax=Streptomyces sp. NPDC001941 TaxID=3154659 RepID=UPI0033179CDD
MEIDHGHRTEPPALPGGLLGVGHSAAFLRDPVAFLIGAQKTMGGPFTFSLLGKRVSYFFGPEANAAVLAAEDAVLDRRPAYRAVIASLGQGVGIGAEPEAMAEQMRLLVPSLQREAMAQHVPVMLTEVEEYVSAWGERGEVDLLDVVHDLSARIAARCLAGPRLAPSLHGRLPALLRDLQGALALGSLVNPYLPLPAFRRRDRAREELLRAVMRAHQQTNPAATGDPVPESQKLYQRFKGAGHGDERQSDDYFAARLVLNAVFAATETTAAHAAWTGVLLLQHHDWLQRLRQEQESLFRDTPAITPQLFGRMTHLRHCAMEAERMHPSVALMMRTTRAPFTHGPYQVPTGRLVLLSPAASHRLPSVFRDPDRYDPARFAPGREEHRSRPTPLIGFGGGQHPCVGMNFAYQQITVIWSVLLRAFDLELVSPSTARDRRALMNIPRRPTLVRYRRRPHAARTLA